MRITQLPEAASVAQTDDLAIDVPGGRTYRVPRSVLAPAPFMVTITTGQWSGSGSDYYITVSASNVTVNSILKPFWDNASNDLLNGPVWCVPAAGSFTIHTSAIPAGTVTIVVELSGIVGEAQYQVLSDVYSKSQVDSIVQQSTAYETITDFDSFKPTDTSRVTRRYGSCIGETAAHAPVSGNSETFRGYVEGTPTYFTQHFTTEYATINSKEGREFIRVCLSGTFLPWLEVKSTLPLATVASNGTLTINVSNYTMFKLTVTSYRVADMGIAFITTVTSGTIAIKWIGTAPSNIDISTYSDGIITLTNNDPANPVYVSIEPIRGPYISI